MSNEARIAYLQGLINHDLVIVESMKAANIQHCLKKPVVGPLPYQESVFSDLAASIWHHANAIQELV